MSKSKSKWRRASEVIIKRVMQENEGLDRKEMRKEISKAYPWGARENHPYQMWLKEVKRLCPREGKIPTEVTVVEQGDVRNLWLDKRPRNARSESYE